MVLSNNGVGIGSTGERIKIRYCQYPGEEEFILEFFENKKGGGCVEMGAADGIENSNSRKLIESLEWGALLVEPHPEYYASLERLYKDNDSITLKNVAVYNKRGSMSFHIYKDETAWLSKTSTKDEIGGQVSTLSTEFKERVIKKHGDQYISTIEVEVVTLENILSSLKEVDFLSVDCEGVDMEVLISNDWEKYRPQLLCVETSMPLNALESFISKIKYTQVFTSVGNMFFQPISSLVVSSL